MPATTPSHNLQPVAAGPAASCRAWPWTVAGRRRSGAVTATDVVARAAGAPEVDTFLEPFDIFTPMGRADRWHAGSAATLRDAIGSWPTVAWPEMPIVAAVDVPVTAMPHQLLPALAVMTGQATRLLLADPVGMGKTIEAGLVIRELEAHGAAARVLILTPASLRDQWHVELRTRLSMPSTVVDRAAVEERRSVMPPGIGVFRPPGCHVMSVDLARQPDVVALLIGVIWDVLVIDEAHLVAGDTARSAAAAQIAARARVVLLLTATPHSGDAAAFHRLCALGRLDGEPAIALVRSPGASVSRPAPRHRDIVLRPTPLERAARDWLASYLRLLDGQVSGPARLVGVVLRKRALSSAAALAASLRHRLEWIDRQPGTAAQPSLPFADGETEDDDVAQPAVLRQAPSCGSGERAALVRALDAATAAAADCGKHRVLTRLLQRTRERAIVFTEYRDTLEAVAAGLAGRTAFVALHGGLERQARADALRAFAEGHVRILLATDVAAEGLNLQHACRLVVHFELPWSPVRLAQRNGRVDRIGQSRRVHVWRLLGDRRHEARVLAALADRVARIAASGVDVGDLSMRASETPQWTDCMPVDIRAEDAIEAARAAALMRRLVDENRDRPRGRARAGVPWRQVRYKPGQLPRGVILALLLQRSAIGSRPMIRFVHVELRRWPEGHPSAWLPAIAAQAAERIGPPDAGLASVLRAREEGLLARARQDEGRHRHRWQASLFERRAASIVAAMREASIARLEEHRVRLAALDVVPLPPVPVFALLVR
jgi:superfamily II DNA or RNA helicase